jgi:membrane AbrB-like protein
MASSEGEDKKGLRPVILRALGAFVLGSLGGFLFLYLNFPLPFTLGSLTAVGVAAILGSRLLMPPPVRHVARPVIGVLAGSAFTTEVVANLALWWPIVPAVVIYGIVTAVLGWLYFIHVCRFDRATAAFAGFPGGLGELTLLGGMFGADMRQLALVHSARVIAVVFTVPFLVQALAGPIGVGTGPAASSAAESANLADWLLLTGCGVGGYLLRSIFRPLGGAMVAALVLSALVHGTGLTAAHPPDWLVALVQIVIGSIVGSRLGGTRGRELVATMLQSFVWALVLIALAALMALSLSGFIGQSVPTLLLAFAPGGLMEMTIVAYAIGLQVAFVVTAQICRTTATMILAPLMFRFLGSPPASSQSRKET